MNRWIAALTLCVLTAAPAWGWDLAALNQTINQTNFVLDERCSATLISLKYRLVLTNYHCVSDKVSVVEREEPGPDGTMRKVRREKYETVRLVQKAYKGFEQVGASEFHAEIVAHRMGRDLALVQIKADTIPHSVESRILPETKTLSRGERVYAVGNPRQLDATVTDGIISNLTRTLEVPWTGNERLAFVQFTAPITGGNSGGALYNADGYLIGVPAAMAPGEGAIGLAVPVTLVRELLKGACFESVYAPGADDAKCTEAREAKKRKAVEK